MFPLFSIIIAFSIALMYPALVSGAPPANLAGVGLTLCVAVVLYRGVSGRAARLATDEPEHGPVHVIRASGLLRIANVAVFGVVLYVFHWPGVLGPLGLEGWILVDELVVLVPFFFLLTLSILAAYQAERACGMHDFTVGRYLTFQYRQYLLPTLPLCVYILIGDGIGAGSRAGIRWIAELQILYKYYDFVQWVSLGVILFGLYCLIPFLLKWFWRAKSMPPGPLRERLDRFSKREGFRARDILVWPTDHNVLNAAVIGVAGPVRYVLMTDALIEELPEEEVEAVFAHEVGHARHRHMLLFFLFTVGYALLIFLLREMLQGWIMTSIPNPTVAIAILGLGGFLVWFGILFGFVSRRFEQQADVFGALSTGRAHPGREFTADDHPFVCALEGIGMQMGDLRESKGWRHFSLGDRIAFLKSFLADEGVQRSYHRGMTALLAFFFGLLLSLGIAAAATIPDQIERARVPARLERAGWLVRHGYESEVVKDAEERARREAERARSDLRLRALRAHQTLWMVDHAVDTHGYYPRPVLTLGARVSLQLDLAIAYRDLGMLRAARLTLDEIHAELGNVPRILALIGDVLEKEGRKGGAALAFRDALARLPKDHPDAVLLRARLKALQGE